MLELARYLGGWMIETKPTYQLLGRLLKNSIFDGPNSWFAIATPIFGGAAPMATATSSADLAPVRNAPLASLFGIPSERMRVPKIVAGSLSVDIEIGAVDLCADIESCGPHGACYEGACACEKTVHSASAS